jgi:hypothetical protein
MKRILLAAVCAVTLLVAPSAQGAELLYWDNFGDGTVSFADASGNGGGPLNLSGIRIDGPEGMAIDSATGRIFVADSGGVEGRTGQIVAVSLDGSGAKVFSAPGAPVSIPAGIAIDPATRTAYWSNSRTNTIAWARLDGSAGGTLNTAGASVRVPARVALDVPGGRIYWVNAATNPELISFARLDNSGGGDLDLSGATPPDDLKGLSLDPTAGRIYWLNNNLGSIGFASLAGGGGGDLAIPAQAAFSDPFGLAFDPQVGRFYWGNFGNLNDRPGAIGFADLAGGGGGISIATAPVNGPQDPVILKSPTGTAAPALTRSAKSRTELSCSTGEWAPDFAGSFVYRGPSKFAYQWTRDGTPLAGATASTLNATAAGAYSCTVTASNQAGAATQASASATVKPGKLKLTLKRSVVTKPGRLAKLKLRISNVGDLATERAQLCLKTGKRAKALEPLKCKKLPRIPAGAGLAGTLQLRVGAGASGTYRVKLSVKGAPAKAATAKVVVR